MSVVIINKVASETYIKGCYHILMTVENWKTFQEKFGNQSACSYRKNLMIVHESRTVIIDENFEIPKMGTLIIARDGEFEKHVHNVGYDLSCRCYVDEIFKKMLESNFNFEIEETTEDAYFRYIPYEFNNQTTFIDLYHNNKLIARRSYKKSLENHGIDVVLPIVGKYQKVYYGPRSDEFVIDDEKYLVAAYRV
jgi:hypothetical protein